MSVLQMKLDMFDMYCHCTGHVSHVLLRSSLPENLVSERRKGPNFHHGHKLHFKVPTSTTCRYRSVRLHFHPPMLYSCSFVGTAKSKRAMPPADLRTENLDKQVVHTHTHTHTHLCSPPSGLIGNSQYSIFANKEE